MPTKSEPKRARAKMRALKKKAAKKTRARIDRLVDAEAHPSPPVSEWQPPAVSLSVNPGPGLMVEVSASMEVALSFLQWLQGRQLPTSGAAPQPDARRWETRDAELKLVSMQLQAPGLQVRVIANKDVAEAVMGYLMPWFPNAIGVERRPAPVAMPDPPAPVDDERPFCYKCCRHRAAGCLCAAVTPYPWPEGVTPPPQGVRFEDDPQGNPRVVKNEPTNG